MSPAAAREPAVREPAAREPATGEPAAVIRWRSLSRVFAAAAILLAPFGGEVAQAKQPAPQRKPAPSAKINKRAPLKRRGLLKKHIAAKKRVPRVKRAALAKAKQTTPKRQIPRHAKAKPKTKRSSKRTLLDRVVVRWHARATGGIASPQFISARELAFEARIEALTQSERRMPYADKHVRRALERHVAEVILASLPVDQAQTPKQVATEAEKARLIIEQQVGGRANLNKSASAEGIGAEELNALLRRRARAAWYIDRMVAPMLAPSDLELRLAHKRRQTPYSDQPFEKVVDALRRWYVSRELDDALTRYFRNVRGRVTISVIRS